MPRHHTLTWLRLLRPTATFALQAATLVLLFGCGTPTMRVRIPPQVDLKSWPIIGVVDFTTNGYPPLGKEATEKFIQNLATAQPGARLLELGRGDLILHELNRNTFDPETIRAMESRYKVAAVLLGHLELSGMNPDIHISPSLDAMSASAKVNADLSAKIMETATGATVWSNGAHGRWSMGGLRYSSGSLSNLHYQDPGQQYRKMILDLASVATNDFRPTYEVRPVTP